MVKTNTPTWPCATGCCPGSQLNAVARLNEAGIIANNLVVLPNTSNISLANNGTHLSLGSRRLTGLLSGGSANFGAVEEKYLGDLVLKISEHFLPLFVGSYSAAPYRLDFQDFHPEKALGFLPHELHDIHLRMIWRRWRGKADIKLLGQPVTPFGPEWLDRLVSRTCRLRGDLVPDFRLIDYLVSVMSTEESPAMGRHTGQRRAAQEGSGRPGGLQCRPCRSICCTGCGRSRPTAFAVSKAATTASSKMSWRTWAGPPICSCWSRQRPTATPWPAG